eukprot:6144524-Lingulodinium_polyedra.AAC.1
MARSPEATKVLPGTAWWAEPLWTAVESCRMCLPRVPQRPMLADGLCSGTAGEIWGFEARLRGAVCTGTPGMHSHTRVASSWQLSTS